MNKKGLTVAVNFEFANTAQQLGMNVLKIKSNELLPKPVSAHADMNICVFEKTAFVLCGCDYLIEPLKEAGYKVFETEKLPKPSYPNDVLLNCAIVGKFVFANIKTVSNRLLEHLEKADYKLINVNQGYAKCSIYIAGDNAIITADSGIYEAAKKHGIDALKIGEGHVLLSGYNYGFIGGCGGMINSKTALFFGDVSKHPDYIKIKEFLNKRNIEIKKTDGELTDVGSLIIL